MNFPVPSVAYEPGIVLCLLRVLQPVDESRAEMGIV